MFHRNEDGVVLIRSDRIWPWWIMSFSNNFIPIWSFWQFQSFLIELQIWRLNRETVSWFLNRKSHVRNVRVDFHVRSCVPSTTMFYDHWICYQEKRFSVPLFLLERKPMVLNTSEEVSVNASVISRDIVITLCMQYKRFFVL